MSEAQAIGIIRQAIEISIMVTAPLLLAGLVAGVLVIALIWMGPETRGRQFKAADDEAA